jgi:hypothetical protein
MITQNGEAKRKDQGVITFSQMKVTQDDLGKTLKQLAEEIRSADYEFSDGDIVKCLNAGLDLTYFRSRATRVTPEQRLKNKTLKRTEFLLSTKKSLMDLGLDESVAEQVAQKQADKAGL